MNVATDIDDRQLRELAIKQLKKKQEFLSHLLAYVTVNLLLIGVWFFAGAGFFWPVFPLLGWGIGLTFHALDVYGPRISEERVDQEMERLRRG